MSLLAPTSLLVRAQHFSRGVNNLMATRSKPIHEVFTHVGPFSLGGGVTIDSCSPQYDDGAMACARTGWVNPKADSTFVQAASNLASYSRIEVKDKLSDKNLSLLVLVGHGTAGLISTGDGTVPRTAQGYISSATYGAWQPFFANIRGHGQFLTLLGCDCGAGAAGAQFLYQLATLINMPVQGRTGLIYLSCPGAYVSYQNGSVWQVAQPGVLPTPINPPTGSLRAIPPQAIWLKAKGMVPIGSIESVTISSPAGRTANLTSETALSLITMANLDQPLTAPGDPTAVLTAKIVISFKQRRTKFQMTFLVFNDRLLRHDNDPATFNLCSPGFTEALHRLWI